MDSEILQVLEEFKQYGILDQEQYQRQKDRLKNFVWSATKQDWEKIIVGEVKHD